MSGKQLRVLKGHNSTVRGHSSDPGSPALYFLAVASLSLTLVFCFLKIYSASLSFDGRLLATSSADQSVRIWNVESGECIKVMVGRG